MECNHCCVHNGIHASDCETGKRIKEMEKQMEIEAPKQPRPERSTVASGSATITVDSDCMQISHEGGKSYLKFRIKTEGMDKFLGDYDGKNFAGATILITAK